MEAHPPPSDSLAGVLRLTMTQRQQGPWGWAPPGRATNTSHHPCDLCSSPRTQSERCWCSRAGEAPEACEPRERAWLRCPRATEVAVKHVSLGGTRSLDTHSLDHCAHLETERRRKAAGGRGGHQAARAHPPSGHSASRRSPGRRAVDPSTGVQPSPRGRQVTAL